MTGLLLKVKSFLSTVTQQKLGCVASVSVGFSAHSRHFLLFGGAKIVASASLMAKKRKMLQTCGKPCGNACYAG